MVLHIEGHRAPCLSFPFRDDPSAVVWTVRSWCLDCTAGLVVSSTTEVQQYAIAAVGLWSVLGARIRDKDS